MRRCLVVGLEAEADIKVVGKAHDGASAHSELRRTQADVVVLELPSSPFAAPLPPEQYADAAFPQDQGFELFTDRARRVVVLAQEEARLLNHNYIGTEHILLGLVHESLAAKALELLGISLEKVRQQVEEVIGAAQSPPSDHVPFTPRAKKVLELSLREAFQLGHNYIGSQHILLGLIREGEGVAAQVLLELGADLGRVRQQVIQLLSGISEPGISEPTERYEWVSVLRELKDAFPAVGIVASLSVDSTPEFASKALEAGATTYALKSNQFELVFAVRVAANLTKPEV